MKIFLLCVTFCPIYQVNSEYSDYGECKYSLESDYIYHRFSGGLGNKRKLSKMKIFLLCVTFCPIYQVNSEYSDYGECKYSLESDYIYHRFSGGLGNKRKLSKMKIFLLCVTFCPIYQVNSEYSDYGECKYSLESDYIYHRFSGGLGNKKKLSKMKIFLLCVTFCPIYQVNSEYSDYGECKYSLESNYIYYVKES